MKRIILLVSALLLLSVLIAAGQSDTVYYYYKGEKVYLTSSRRSVLLTVGSNYGISSGDDLATNLGPNFTVAYFGTSNVLQTLLPEDSIDTDTFSEYWATVELDTSLSYKDQVDRLRENRGVKLVTPYYRLDGGNGQVGLSAYFYVKLSSGSDVALLRATASATGTEVVGSNPFMPLWYTLRSTDRSPYNALEAANYFYETGHFAAAQPDLLSDNLLQHAPDDPLYTSQWGLSNRGQYGGDTTGIDIRTEAAWNITTGDPGIVVAVIDQGFEMHHPDLNDNVFGRGYDAQTGTYPSVVRGPHGTACAGIIGAVRNNGVGVAGIAPDASISSISVGFTKSTTIQMLANGINWAVENGADVISNSWSGGAPLEMLDEAIANALTNGRDGLGTVIVFSTGNNNGVVNYPTNSHPDILAVGAMSPCGERKRSSSDPDRVNPDLPVLPDPGGVSCDSTNQWGSNYGEALDVMAPGVLIPTTDRQGALGYVVGDYFDAFGGTSAACPHVAGVAALVLSVNPRLTAKEVNDIIEQSAQKVGGYDYQPAAGRPNGSWNTEVGYGLVNAHAAVLLAQCQDHLVVDLDIPGGVHHRREADLTLTATNTIAASGSAVYHAGNKVILNPGFLATAGSAFLAYNEGCTGDFRTISRAAFASAESAPVAAAKSEAAEAPDQQRLVLYPNPADQSLSVRLGSGSDYEVSVYDYAGNALITGSLTDSNGSLDISRLVAGPYLIRVTDIKTGETGEGRFMVVR